MSDQADVDSGSLSHRFFDRVSIDLCRRERFCLQSVSRLDDSVKTVEVLVHSQNAKPFVLDGIRRFLGKPIEKVLVGDLELEQIINSQYESSRMRAYSDALELVSFRGCAD
jgi:hypothetical protein